MPPIIVVFVGPAGSGKTSLVKAYSEWASTRLLMKVGIVNLDPGAENIEYQPVFDIREFFTLRYIMEKYGLGPNGAFIKASELIAEKTTDILHKPPFSNPSRWDLILVDTPGQMEAFIFRPSSRVFLESLVKLGNVVIAYLIDASAIDKVSDAVFLWFLFVLIQVKTGLITVPIINKRDIARNLRIAELLVINPSKLLGEPIDEGLATDIIPDLVEIVNKTKGPFRAVLVSAKIIEDMEYLHALIHEAFCACGDLT
ncbi:MAG: ATP/GTP-binding protein [Desulfurococcaceae archaeon]